MPEEPTDYYCEVGLAKLRRDRWGALGLWPDRTKGCVWSAPLRVPEKGLQVVLNADGARGMKIELADAQFNLIGDYSADLAGVAEGDIGLDLPVTWPSGDLAAVAGNTVRMRITLQKSGDSNPRLYAIYLSANTSE